MNLRRIWARSASKNVAASYSSFLSFALWGIISIPIAVAYLEKDEIGLWTVVNAFLGFLVWLDLGIGSATARLIADAVFSRNQQEIDRWWTALQSVLYIQGALVIVVGIFITPFAIEWMKVPQSLHAEARLLLLGGVVVVGLCFPLRSASGLLVAQNRFHWVLLLQGITPWINLLVFYNLLRAGMGLRAYFIAAVVSQAFTWLGFAYLIAKGPDRPRWRRGGYEGWRFRTIFTLSGNMAITGFIDAILQSLPSILLARVGGLSQVPLYNFSSKGPTLGGQVLIRTYQSFYPGLQRIYVAGDRESFREKYAGIGMFIVSLGVAGAALVLAANPVLVQLLAESGFYAGSAANVWFAVAVVTMPVSMYFRALLPISGSMGILAVVSFGSLLVGGIASVLLWRAFGLSGIAAVFAVVPMMGGSYAYFSGTVNCGFSRNKLARGVALYALAAIPVILLTHLATERFSTPGDSYVILGRTVVLPGLGTLTPSAILLAIATILVVHFLKQMAKSSR